MTISILPVQFDIEIREYDCGTAIQVILIVTLTESVQPMMLYVLIVLTAPQGVFDFACQSSSQSRKCVGSISDSKGKKNISQCA